MESFREAASKETCFSFYLEKGQLFIQFKFYYSGKKEHLFCRISVKNTPEKNKQKNNIYFAV